jgi:hypothetical protein
MLTDSIYLPWVIARNDRYTVCSWILGSPESQHSQVNHSPSQPPTFYPTILEIRLSIVRIVQSHSITTPWTPGTSRTRHTLNIKMVTSHDALAPSAEEFLKASYDFIICGGGTAGLAIAARLTENPDVVVGVIEAGPCNLDDMLVDTPLMFAQMFGKKEYEWNFKTAPQACVGLCD